MLPPGLFRPRDLHGVRHGGTAPQVGTGPPEQAALKRRRLWTGLAVVGVLALVVLVLIWPEDDVSFDRVMYDDAVERGHYLVTAGACESCHTPRDRPELVLAGGTEFPSPFGTFYIPNITPDPETGIGGWSDEDFVRAMRNGVSPDGNHYYPTFPYRWYRRLTDADLIAMKRYLESIPAIRHEVREHDLTFPFTIRLAVGFWKLANLRDDDAAEPGHSALEARGAYLVEALGHCGACHTQAAASALFVPGEHLAGESDPLGPYAAPNITPHPNGIGNWSVGDVMRVLAEGMRPDGTPVRGAMAEYVAESTGRLTAADQAAMVAYLQTVEPKPDRIKRTPEDEVPPEDRELTLAYTVPRHPDLVRGRALALTGAGDVPACASCHGVLPGAEMAGMPVLRGQSGIYLDGRLDDYASGRTYNPVMTPIAKALADGDRAAVSSWYAGLEPPYGDAADILARRNTWPADALGVRLAEVGDPDRGLPACEACHGGLGTGYGPSYPYLSGQEQSYIVAQFDYWRRGVRDGGELDIMKRIAAGLSGEEVRAVAAYYASLGGGRADRRIAARGGD